MKDVRRRFSRRGVSEGLLGYRELLDDVLQQGRVGQQVAAERRVLQHHGQDLAQLRQLLLTQVPDPQRLQDGTHQPRHVGQRGHTGAPYRLAAEEGKTQIRVERIT